MAMQCTTVVRLSNQLRAQLTATCRHDSQLIFVKKQLKKKAACDGLYEGLSLSK